MTTQMLFPRGFSNVCLALSLLPSHSTLQSLPRTALRRKPIGANVYVSNPNERDGQGFTTLFVKSIKTELQMSRRT